MSTFESGRAGCHAARTPRARTRERATGLTVVFSTVVAAAFLAFASAAEFQLVTQASQGAGTPGVWMAVEEHCGEWGCHWSGTFSPTGGGPWLTGVSLDSGRDVHGAGDSFAVHALASPLGEVAFADGASLTPAGAWAVVFGAGSLFCLCFAGWAFYRLTHRAPT